MSEEMAMSDNVSSDDAKLNGDDAAAASAVVAEAPSMEAPPESEKPPVEDNVAEESTKGAVDEIDSKQELDKKPVIEDEKPEVKDDIKNDIADVKEDIADVKDETPIDNIKEESDPAVPKEDLADQDDAAGDAKHMEVDNGTDDRRGLKRRASSAFSDAGNDDFMGFDAADSSDLSGYSRVLERLEAEVTAASKDFKPLRSVMATPSAPVRASKRARQDTDGSRPSSALSSRSDGDGGISTDAASSPLQRGQRRATAEMSSPLLRVPLESGWKRELVYRAALDAHSRRNADIYYYTPQGKKLRSTREVSEHLSGTGLTIENFSFFKEPLGVDDPEKEIIRDARLMSARRGESPVSAPAAPVEGKRTPKPKPAKGASPEPAKSPPAKLRVKSMGSRLSNNSSATPTPPATKAKKPAAPTDNNNTAAWKKPRPPPAPAPATASAPVPAPATASVAAAAPVPPAPPPPLQSRPAVHSSPEQERPPSRQVVQPCSLTCGRGVPSLACAACLCLYHPACIQHRGPAPQPFYCKNCRKSPSPPVEPPPLTHKSGVTPANMASLPAPVPRRVPLPVPVPVPVPKPEPTPKEKRVLLRMKAAAGGAAGERVWAVAGGAAAAANTCGPRASPHALPQSLVRLNGRRFIVVPQHKLHAVLEDKRRTRLANGASPPPALSPRRRGRPRHDDTDHFTAFAHRAHEHNYDVAVQIFQYLGMRDLAHCARVCKMWRQMAATPALWRHVRMKNSHVSDWGGLCTALKRHGTKWLDLRKMLLPQNDTVFWEQFAQHISMVDTLERIELCRCPARAVEAVCAGLPNLVALSALAIRSPALDPAPLARLPRLRELRLKSMAGLALARDLKPLASLEHLAHLSLTSIKELGWCACDVIGQLSQLESLELGECTFRAEFANVLGRLARLRRLRLERGTAQCAAPALLRALAALPLLTRLELVNVDVKVGFDDALAECKNIQRLLIIPTYVSQSATTNKQVLSGVLRLKDTLTHLMWGVTIELLRVTELFIDQCEQVGDAKRRDVGECIPVLKPVPGCKLPDEHQHVAGPPQVEILPLPTLQRLLSAQMPNTKLKLLRIPFHATWRQSLADFQ